jgi:hypothetical protein
MTGPVVPSRRVAEVAVEIERLDLYLPHDMRESAYPVARLLADELATRSLSGRLRAEVGDHVTVRVGPLAPQTTDREVASAIADAVTAALLVERTPEDAP